MYSHKFLFCVAFPSFAGTVAFSLSLASSFSLACKSVCPSRALSVPSLRCFALCSASCVSAMSTSLFRFCAAVAAWTSAMDISVPSSCLRSVAFGSASFVCPPSCSLFRFLSAMAAQTSAMARAFFSFAAFTGTFACVAATRCTALLMLPRGMGHFQQLLQTWSPLQEPCCASHASKAHAACCTLHTLHLHQPQALREQSKHTLPPLRARCHAVYFLFGIYKEGSWKNLWRSMRHSTNHRLKGKTDPCSDLSI